MDTKENTATTTRNIKSAISIYAKGNSCLEDNVDFSIEEVKTFISKQGSMVAIDLEDLDSYKQNKAPITQSFTIKLFEKKDTKFDIKNSISILDEKSKVSMKILKNSNISYYDGINKDLKEYIRKEKAKEKILIDTQEGNLEEDLSSFVNALKATKDLEQDFSIQIYDSTSFIPSRKGKIEYPYIPYIEYKEVSRSYLFIEEGATIAEMIQSTDGKSGFNCLGELRSPSSVSKINTGEIRAGENIIVEQDDKHTSFKSAIDGVVSLRQFVFSVSKEFTFIGLDFKECNSFKAPLDREDIFVEIRESEEHGDAVGSSIKIQACNVNIIGDVGPSVKILAKNVKILGSTHQTSKVVAQECFIKSSKGKVRADNIEILSLEHGSLQGGDIKITNTQGGKVRGVNISIQNLHSNTLIIASHSIEVENINGTQNNFIICARGNKEFAKEIDTLESTIKEFNINYPKPKMESLNDQFNLHVRKAKALKSKIKILSAKKKDTSELMKEIKLIIVSMNNMKKIFAQSRESEECMLKLKKYDEALAQGIITSQSDWKKNNKIGFQQVSSMRLTSCTPEPNMRKFTLDSSGDKEMVLMEK